MATHIKIGGIGTAYIIAIALVGAGLWECGLGWAQLMGFVASRHSLYPVTGSFYNPGPYCGFLAMLMPVALYYVLDSRSRLLHWVGWTYIIPVVVIMPVLMGRTGWMAAIAGCVLTGIGCGRIRRPRPVFIVVAAVVAIIITAFMIYLKPASAHGRLFLWCIGLSAVMEQPLTGVGWNHVAGALGDVQEAYFRAHADSVFISVAGVPEYAFNEFLQIGIAFGIPTMLIFIAIIVGTGIMAWRGSAYGIAGGIASFAIVCFSSYPLQFMEFIVAIGVIMLGAVVAAPCNSSICKVLPCVMLGGIVVMSCSWQIRRSVLDSRWSELCYVSQCKLDSSTIQRLDSLLVVHGESVRFLFDYGKALRESGFYEKSTVVLLEGILVSSDPMFLNLIGRNKQDLGLYAEAEHYFLRSCHRLPNRMYPYYLLARLYADPAVGDSKKFQIIYDDIIEMKPKVMTPAIKQMRRELDLLRDSIVGS